MFSSNIISYFILSEIFNIYLKHIQKYKSRYQYKSILDKALCVDAIQKILDSNKVRVPKVFVNFWSICMILGISTKSIHIIHDYAQADMKEFCTTTFLFNYIIGPVNLVLVKYRDYTLKSRAGMIINKKQECNNCYNLIYEVLN